MIPYSLSPPRQAVIIILMDWTGYWNRGIRRIHGIMILLQILMNIP